MEYVVDVQGFKTSLNEFVFKEVAILALEEDATPSVFLFEPYCKWSSLTSGSRCRNRWLEKNFHGIPWSAGEIRYKDLVRTLLNVLRDASKIYVKGLEKQRWLRKVLPDEGIIYNIEDFGCPALSSLRKEVNMLCNHHPLCWNPVCALRNVYSMKNFLLSRYRRSRDVVDTTKEDQERMAAMIINEFNTAQEQKRVTSRIKNICNIL